jgi:hypothetical protein
MAAAEAEAAGPLRRALFVLAVLALLLVAAPAAEAWTGEIRGHVVCDVCGDAAIGPEDHVLEGILPYPTALRARSSVLDVDFVRAVPRVDLELRVGCPASPVLDLALRWRS